MARAASGVCPPELDSMDLLHFVTRAPGCAVASVFDKTAAPTLPASIASDPERIYATCDDTAFRIGIYLSVTSLRHCVALCLRYVADQ